MKSLKSCLIGVLFILSQITQEGHPYEIPAHLRITLGAGKVWQEIPPELGSKLGGGNKLDKACKAEYDIGDDIYTGSGEEDLGESPFPCTGFEQTITNDGRNGFFEHFWNPDFPRLTPSNEEQRGYNCGELGDGYNLGLPAILPSACGDHFDSAYRTAQDEWDKAIILYRTGEADKIEEAYYKLGLVAHLLEDIALPAHVHLTPHPQGVVKKIPKTSFLAGPDLYEAFVTARIVDKIAKLGNAIGQEYNVDCLPNLCNFDWSQVHPNPTNLFKLFWYTAQKTQYFASRTTGAFRNAPLVGIGNNFFIDLSGHPHIFSPSLWEGEAEPISDPSELTGKKKAVNAKLQKMADALIPHALKAVAGLYRLFWEETHPPEEPLVFNGLGVDFIATALSSDGSTIVGYIRDKLPPQRPYSVRWTSASGLELLAEAAQAVGGSFANAVSADGNIVAGAMFTPESEAFWWTEAGGMVGLGDLPGGLNHSFAFGISADGSIIAGNGYALRTEAVRWIKNPSTGLFEIDPLNSSVPFFSEAFDVSADGTAIVGYNSDANREATLWRNEEITRLGDLPGGVFDSFARKISANGLVVVGESQSATAWSAFRWTQSDGMVDLGNLPLGFQAFVSGVSGDGSIIVGTDYYCCPGRYEIFIWDPVNGMRQLADVLISRGVGLAGWTLDRVAGVSGDGKTIAGSGINPNSQDEVWIVRNFKP